MKQFTGLNGQVYTTNNLLGKGGEGAVYAIDGMPDYVLKEYLPGKTNRTKERKIYIMASIYKNLPQSAMRQVTWPVDAVYSNGRFAGFVMASVSGKKDINYLYSPDPSLNGGIGIEGRIVIAKNLCVAVNAVHKIGQVCGDLNPKNVLADPATGGVTLVDTDSFQIKGTAQDGKVLFFPCEVGLPEYFPYELQMRIKSGNGKSLSDIASASNPAFTQETDLFALAGHIFRLLMNGFDPFAVATSPTTNRQSSIAAPQPVENIVNGCFIYAVPVVGLRPPPLAPDYSYIPKYIADMFYKAFIAANSDPKLRPTAEEWHNALGRFQNEVRSWRTCQKNNAHKIPPGMSKCPWCRSAGNISVVSNPVSPNPFTGIQIPQHLSANQSGGATQTRRRPRKSTSTGQHYVPPVKNPVRAKHCFLSVMLSIAVQGFWHFTFGRHLTEYFFGYAYRAGFSSCMGNLGIWFQPWGYLFLTLLISFLFSFSLFSADKGKSLTKSISVYLFILFPIAPLILSFVLKLLLWVLQFILTAIFG